MEMEVISCAMDLLHDYVDDIYSAEHVVSQALQSGKSIEELLEGLGNISVRVASLTRALQTQAAELAVHAN